MRQGLQTYSYFRKCLNTAIIFVKNICWTYLKDRTKVVANECNKQSVDYTIWKKTFQRVKLHYNFFKCRTYSMKRWHTLRVGNDLLHVPTYYIIQSHTCSSIRIILVLVRFESCILFYIQCMEIFSFAIGIFYIKLLIGYFDSIHWYLNCHYIQQTRHHSSVYTQTWRF